MNARQFLLCSIDIKDKKIWSELITATGSMREQELLAGGWEFFNEDHFHYDESTDHDFNYRNALRYARNFNLLSSTAIDQTETFSRKLENLTVNGRDASLIVDYHGNFLFIVCYRITPDPNSNVQNVIESLFRNRSVVNNVGDHDWYNRTEQAIKKEVAMYVNKILGAGDLSAERIVLNPDAAFPLFISEADASENIHDLFYNEENIEQRSRKSPLSQDYDGSYFHVGWNYTLALGFPREVNEHIFSLMTKMQMSYYKFRYYKDYFNETFNDLFKNARNIDSKKVDFFDRLQLNYHDFITNYNKFKLGLFPKFHVEMDKVEKLWHMDKDMDLMEKIFAAQAEFVNKKYNDINQEINDKQNQALTIIAFVQVIAFLSVIYDSVELKEKDINLFWVSLAFVITILVTLIARHYHIGNSRKLSN